VGVAGEEGSEEKRKEQGGFSEWWSGGRTRGRLACNWFSFKGLPTSGLFYSAFLRYNLEANNFLFL